MNPPCDAQAGRMIQPHQSCLKCHADAGKPVEGPVIDGVHNLIGWADRRIEAGEHRVEAVKTCIVQRIDNFRDDVHQKWHEAKVGFWLVMLTLLVYSPPVKRLFGAK